MAVLVWVSQLLVLGVGLGVVGPWVLLDVGARHSWLRAWWVLLFGLPLCPSGVSGGPAAPLAEGCWALVLWVFPSCVRLWCGRCLRFGVVCALVGLVLVAAVAFCDVCARGRVCGVLVVGLGTCPRLSGLVFAALCEPRGCVLWPLSPPRCGAQVWFPAAPFFVSSPLFLFAASLGVLSPWCLVRAYLGCGGCAVGLDGVGGRGL